MAMIDTSAFSTRATPQRDRVPGKAQVENSAGGFVFAIDDWMRLDRFLVLGTEGGSYYTSERKLTRGAAEATLRCIQADGARAVARIVEVSEAGRAPKNESALFALAMAAKLGDAATREAALRALPRVARIGTHLFHFLAYLENFGGWGRSTRKGVGEWYQSKSADALAYQLVKYQQRDGWGHRDALCLSHPKPRDAAHAALYEWAVKGASSGVAEIPLVAAFLEAKSGDKATVIRLIREHGLTREMVPSEHLADAQVMAALLEKMPLTAMIRNLGNLTRLGVVAPMSDGARRVFDCLGDEATIRKARVHPIAVLTALLTYRAGHGAKGNHAWDPVPQVVDALDAAFYLAFGNVETTGKRTMLALDVSGSMDNGEIAGVYGLTPRIGAGAMAMVTAASETNWCAVAFTAPPGGGYGGRWSPSESGVTPLSISPRQRLDDVCRTMRKLPMGGTDCALPMIHAQRAGFSVDTFVVYTDSETWAGAVHPFQALRTYREHTGIAAKLVVVGMVASEFSIADPSDAGMLDVVGFDSAAPQVIADFSRG